MTLKNKIVSADEAIAIIRDGDTICVSGFVGIGTPDELILALERRFLKEEHPSNLTLVFAAAPGDGKDRGLNRLAHKGLLKRVIGGHWSLVPKIAELALDDAIEAYNLPLGCISHLFREIAAHRPGTISKVGLRTFVDPREQGGKLNSVTTEDLVEVLNIGGEEWLRYKAFPINVAFIRGTTCDPNGNTTMEREALTLDNLAIAMAAKNSGGFVIAQVERIAAADSLIILGRSRFQAFWWIAWCWVKSRITSRPMAHPITTPSLADSAFRLVASRRWSWTTERS